MIKISEVVSVIIYFIVKISEIVGVIAWSIEKIDWNSGYNNVFYY